MKLNCLVAALLLASAASARSIQLEIHSVPSCPSRVSVQTRLAQLAPDLRLEPGPERASIRFSRSVTKATAQVELGGLTRLFQVPPDECASLLGPVSLALVLAAPPSAPPPAPAPIVSTVPPPQISPVSMSAAFAGLTTTGVTPARATGGTITLGARLEGWSVNLGLTALLPATAPTGEGDIIADLRSATLAGCRHFGVLATCLGLQGGRQTATGDRFASVEKHTASFLAITGRLHARWPADGRWFAAPFVEAALPLSTLKLRVDDAVAFETASTIWSAGLGVGARFSWGSNR